MRTLQESILDDLTGQTRDLKRQMIEEWLEENHIKEDRDTWPLKYRINKDYTIDISYFVYMGKGNFPDFIQFNRCDVDFSCCGAEMTSLKGCPKYVGEIFNCSNNKLKTLKYGPISADYYFCTDNQLKTLEYCSKSNMHQLDCSNNELESLKGCPRVITDIFDCSYNKLKTLKYSPKHTETFVCNDNPLSPEEIEWVKSNLDPKEIRS